MIPLLCLALAAFGLALPPSAGAAQDVCVPRAVPQIAPQAAPCAGATRLRLAVVGDVLLHRPLQERGYRRGFDTLWGAAMPLLRAADLAIANLEGPAAAGVLPNGRVGADPGPRLDDLVYSGYPRFNYHPVVIDQLRAAGIDVVTTANNHALDRGPRGLEATLAALSRRGMGHVGAVASGQPRVTPLRLRTAIGPLSLIACTYGTNGIADPGRQVPLCYRDRARILDLVRAEVRNGAGVLVLPHWGQEYRMTPDPNQTRLARDLVAAGAMAVIGTHPHVPQPWELLQGPAGPVPVVYSTGNFIAAQPPLPRATAIMAWLELCAGPAGPRVAGIGHVPLQMEFDGADPSLTLPRPGLSPRAEAGLALLERLIPGRALTGQVHCRARSRARSRAPTRPAPDPNFER